MIFVIRKALESLSLGVAPERMTEMADEYPMADFSLKAVFMRRQPQLADNQLNIYVHAVKIITSNTLCV